MNLKKQQQRRLTRKLLVRTTLILWLVGFGLTIFTLQSHWRALGSDPQEQSHAILPTNTVVAKVRGNNATGSSPVVSKKLLVRGANNATGSSPLGLLSREQEASLATEDFFELPDGWVAPQKQEEPQNLDHNLADLPQQEQPADSSTKNTPVTKPSESQRLQEERASLITQAVLWLKEKTVQTSETATHENATTTDSQTLETAAHGNATTTDIYPIPSWVSLKQQLRRNPGHYLADNSASCEGFNYTFRRPSHGCQVNQDTKMLHCSFENFRVDLSKIQSDRGGEELATVMGREEAPEFPSYQMGAFAVATRPKHVPLPSEYDGQKFQSSFLLNVLNAMDYPEKGQDQQLNCTETFRGTTMFLTRYEYVNMFHTMTDWWNAYFSLPDEPVRVVFLDAHARGNLDPVWKKLFGPTIFVQHLPKGGVCFEKAIMIPAGYASPIWHRGYRGARCASRSMAEEFCQYVLHRYQLEQVRMIPGKIVLIERVPYTSHPRSKPENAQRIISNVKDLQERLQKIPQVSSVEIVQFENMAFGEQVSKVREANILIGNHGAGLTHVMFMEPQAHLVEFSSTTLDFFPYLSEWKGVDHSLLPIYSNDNMLSESDIDIVAEKVTTLLHA